VGNFEVSVALFSHRIFNLISKCDVSHKTNNIKIKLENDIFYFVETIIRKQFHSLVVNLHMNLIEESENFVCKLLKDKLSDLYFYHDCSIL
jgi:hypothetical protein